MRKNAGRNACILLAAFVLLTILVKVVDVRAIGPKSSRVGFAALNGAVRDLIGYHAFWYNITEILGYAAIALAGCFALIGALQLFRGRSIRAVDPDIICLGGLYGAVILCYIFFEIVVINYRPFILDGTLEASYPSSHTMISIASFMAAAWELGRRLRGQAAVIARYACAFLSVFVPVGRLLSGVHWFTDIIGGTLLGFGLVLAFLYAARKLLRLRRRRAR